MEFHLPGPIRSFKDVLIHLGIITLGILIALGLEQIVEAHHRRSIGRESIESFRREVGADRDDVAEVLGLMPQLREEIAAQIAKLTAAPGDARPQPIHYPGIHFNLMTTSSWDTAIATQALSYIPWEQAKRFSEAYGVLRLFQDIERSGLSTWQDMRSFGTDAAALSPQQRQALIEQLHRYDSFTYVIDLAGKGALEACDRALQQKP